ncbi:MAG: phosphopentomutase [Bacillota bacterium]
MAAAVERVTLIVLDSVGIGALPDAAEYGDEGANTVGNLARAMGGLDLPNLGRLGLGNLLEVQGVPPVDHPEGAYGRMAIASVGKDTMTGHWEIVGIRIDEPFRTYPNGFPEDLIQRFIEATGIGGVLGNKVASGTEIIKELGAEHMRTGWPIVYTSADSVFQIAAHEEVIPLPELYRLCKVARSLLQGEHRVGRVIARPFVGDPERGFTRTANRHDYALEPPPMLLDFVKEAGLEVAAVGKIRDIFSGHGITRAIPTKSNTHGLDVVEELMAERWPGLIFANLVDFDMLYGHRRDPVGYARALKEVDDRLPRLRSLLGDRDVLILTADHGNDPTFRGTDHTREYVPVLITGRPIRSGAYFGTRPTLADLGATVAELLGVPWWGQQGESFASAILA